MKNDSASKIKANPNSKLRIKSSLPQMKRIIKLGMVKMEKIKLKWKFLHIKKMKKFGYAGKDETKKNKANRYRGERIGQKGSHCMYKVIEHDPQLRKYRECIGGSNGLFWYAERCSYCESNGTDDKGMGNNFKGFKRKIKQKQLNFIFMCTED